MKESNPFPFVCIALGSLLIVVGIGLIYEPAAIIAAGLLLYLLAYMGRGLFGGGQ